MVFARSNRHLFEVNFGNLAIPDGSGNGLLLIYWTNCVSQTMRQPWLGKQSLPDGFFERTCKRLGKQSFI